MKLVDEEGNEYEKALFDGYMVGDRILEDVMFEVVVDGDALKCTGPAPECLTYVNDLFSAKKIKGWVDTITEFVNDNNGDGLSSPTDNQTDVWLEL